MQFTGFTREGLQFLDDLKFNNNREWYEANKHIYITGLRDPALAFIEALGAKLKTLSGGVIHYDTRTNGAGSLMRINRDTRFSADKSPYKTNLGIVFWAADGKKLETPSYYFHIDSENILLYTGMYGFQKPMLEAFRRAIADDKSGSELVKIVQSLKAQGAYEVGGEASKRVPAGYSADHPRAEFLKYKGFSARAPQISAAVATSTELVDVCYEYAQKMQPLFEWLLKVYRQSLS